MKVNKGEGLVSINLSVQEDRFSRSGEKKKEENGGSTAGQTESRKHMRKNGGFKALPTKIKAASFISVIGVVYLLFWIRGCMVNRRKTEWKKKRRKKNPEKKGK